MAGVSITLLGGFGASVHGEPVPEKAWRLKKARELVKLLALAPDHRLHREQVMDVLWRDRGPAAAANNLHQAVHVARRALDAEAIELRDEVLFLVADVDVDRLELAAADARRSGTAAAYRAALAVYGGELLPENRYDDWAIDRRAELADLCAELTDELAALDSGDGPRPLPTDASSFVGRGRELGELRALLGHTRLLTLTGTGGAGKTRLALELARGAEASYDGGAALVELAAVADPQLVPDAVAAALDARALPGQDVVDAVVEFLAPRTLLLVLDNCEHLLWATAALVDAILRAAPGLTVLATSREPLRVGGEVVFRVPSLAIPDPEQPLAPADLLALRGGAAVRRARGGSRAGIRARRGERGRRRAHLLPARRPAARARARRRTAGRPRPRRGGRAARRSLPAPPLRQPGSADAAADARGDPPVESRPARAGRADAAAQARQSSPAASSSHAVESVCTGAGLDVAGSADVLARLVEKSLVAADEGGRERRYRLLETVRLYAGERLGDAGETAALAGRHAAWALELTERERDSPRLDPEAANLRAALSTLLAREPGDALRFCVALSPFWLRRIELEEANRRFTAALEAAPERTALRAQALLAAAAIDMRSGTLPRGIARAEESHLIASELGDAHAQWRAMQALAEFGVAMDEAGAADLWLERGLELARRERFGAAEAICIYSLGVTRFVRGDIEGAGERLTQSLELFRALAGSTERIPSLVNVAEMRTSDLTDPRGLRIVFEDTLQPFVEISCDAAIGYVLANLASVARMQGDHARGRALLDEAAERFGQLDDPRGSAAVLVRRAYLHLAEGSTPEARACLEQALLLRRQLNDRRGLGLVLAGLGLIDTTAGDYDNAERNLAEARQIFRRAGDRWGLASTLWRTADLALERGRLDDAEAALREALSALGETHRERWSAHTLAGLAEVAALKGDADRAAELFADARDRYASTDDDLGVASVEERLRALAKAPLSPGKGAPDRPSPATTTKGTK